MLPEIVRPQNYGQQQSVQTCVGPWRRCFSIWCYFLRISSNLAAQYPGMSLWHYGPLGKAVLRGSKCAVLNKHELAWGPYA